MRFRAYHVVPQNYVIDGFDLKKQLSGKVDKKRPESFLMHFPHAHRGSYFTTYRMGDWKLIYYYLPDASQKQSDNKNENIPHWMSQLDEDTNPVIAIVSDK